MPSRKSNLTRTQRELNRSRRAEAKARSALRDIMSGRCRVADEMAGALYQPVKGGRRIVRKTLTDRNY